MPLVCGTCKAVQPGPPSAASARVGAAAELLCVRCGGSLRYETGDGPEPEPEGWFVITATGQGGPYQAPQLGRMIDQGTIDWNTPIWREGLKNWRPARRDDVLITAVAEARGHGSETRRLDRLQHRLFAEGEDTRIDIPLSFLEEARDSMNGEPARPSRPETDSGALELAMAQLRAQTELHRESLPGGRGQGDPKSRPDLVPAEAPLDRTEVGKPLAVRTGPWPGGVASRSGSEPRTQRRRHMLLLALGSFGAGALLTPFLVQKATEPTAEVAPAPAPAIVAPVRPAQEPPAAPAQAPRATRALPPDSEVLSELERIGPAVRACLPESARELEVELRIDGRVGEMRKFDVLSPTMKLERVECVSQALSDLRVSPFTMSELRFRHRYRF